MDVSAEAFGAEALVGELSRGRASQISPSTEMTLVEMWRAVGSPTARARRWKVWSKAQLRAIGRRGGPCHCLASRGRPRQRRPGCDNGAECDGLSGDLARNPQAGGVVVNINPLYTVAGTGVANIDSTPRFLLRPGKFCGDSRCRRGPPETRARHFGAPGDSWAQRA